MSESSDAETIHPDNERTVQERESETTGNGGVRRVQKVECQKRGRQVRGFKWTKQQGKVHRRMNQHGGERLGEGHHGKKEQENQQVVGKMDLQSGEDGLEVNMSDVMDQIQVF